MNAETRICGNAHMREFACAGMRTYGNSRVWECAHAGISFLGNAHMRELAFAVIRVEKRMRGNAGSLGNSNGD